MPYIYNFQYEEGVFLFICRQKIILIFALQLELSNYRFLNGFNFTIHKSTVSVSSQMASFIQSFSRFLVQIFVP
jgi:hypothetical protein